MEDVTTTATESTETTVAETAPVSEPAQEGVSKPEFAENADSVRMVENPNGSKSLEFFNADNSEGEASQEAEQAEPKEDTAQAEQPQQEAPEQPQFYSNDEMMQAISNGALDETKVSPEQRAFLLQAQQRAFQQQQEYARQQAEQQKAMQEKAKAEAQARQQAMAQIAPQAKQAVLQEMGISEDDLKDSSYLDGDLQKQFESKYAETLNNMQYQFMQKQIEQQVMQQVQAREFSTNINEISNFCNAEIAKEPHYNEIIHAMDESLNDMPYGLASKVVEAKEHIQRGTCTAQDLSTFKAYYDECKKQIYQKANNVSTIPKRTAPPKVEKAGNAQQETAKPIDWSVLRNMNSLQKSQMIQKYIASQL